MLLTRPRGVNSILSSTLPSFHGLDFASRSTSWIFGMHRGLLHLAQSCAQPRRTNHHNEVMGTIQWGNPWLHTLRCKPVFTHLDLLLDSDAKVVKVKRNASCASACRRPVVLLFGACTTRSSALLLAILIGSVLVVQPVHLAQTSGGQPLRLWSNPPGEETKDGDGAEDDR